MLAVPGAGRATRGGPGRPGERGRPRHVATPDDAGPERVRGREGGPGPARGARRWDTDERGIGVGDARAWAPTIATLTDLVAIDGWVAEEPERHLLPHLETATAGGPLTVRRTTTDPDGTFVVELEWIRADEPTRRELRAATFVLIGTIAESVTVIHELPAEAGRQIEVLTGLVGPDSPFATHGHTVRFRVTARPSTDEAP